SHRLRAGCATRPFGPVASSFPLLRSLPMKRLTALLVLLASPLPGLTAEEPLSLDGAVALALERAPQVAARDAAREAAASLATSADATHALRALEEDFTLGTAAARGALRAGRSSAVEALEAEAAIARFHNRLLQLEGAQRQADVELERWIGADAQRPAQPLPG